MPADDDSVLLPSPPPPRPAARDAAIGAALRRFDGVEDKPAASPAPARTSWTRKPQFGLLVTASLVAVIGLPAAFIALRSHDLNPPQEVAVTPPRAVAVREDQMAAPAPQPEAPAPLTRLTEEPTMAPPVHHRDVAVSGGSDARQAVAGASNEVVGDVAEPRAMLAAASPPPPAPPPPPQAPAPALAQNSASRAAADQIQVTGSLIRAPAMEKSSKQARREGYAPTAPDLVLKDRSYAAFLTDLQAAVRANDRDAVIGLIAFPLRVNSGGKGRSYRDAAAVRRDYDGIFTPRVRGAILNQRADRLFGRDQGLMIGDGEVWFDHICTNSACSPLGPVRLKAVNP